MILGSTRSRRPAVSPLIVACVIVSGMGTALLAPGKTYWTYDDYAKIPNDGKTYEIIDGELHVSPAANRFHQDASGNFFYALKGHCIRTGAGAVYAAPTDVSPNEKLVVQPDIFFVSKARLKLFTPDGSKFAGAPDLVIEIISKSSVEYDMSEKKAKYEAMGVREYWPVDYKNKRVYVFVLGKNRRYGDPKVHSGDSILTTRILPGLKIRLREIWK